MQKVVSFVRRNAAKVTAGAGAMVASGMAMAQDADLAATATSALNGAKSGINGILVILVGVVFLYVLYKLIKKAS